MVAALSMFGVIWLNGRRNKQYMRFDSYPVYEGDDLESVYSPRQSVFTLWAPTARKVRLNLYRQAGGGAPFKVLKMKKQRNGVWKLAVPGDWKGTFYTFQIRFKSCWLEETPGIWAKAVGVNGNRAAIIDWNETHPAGWENDKYVPLESFTDIVIYEMHYRDFSMGKGSGMKYKGKYLALTEEDTKNASGHVTGLAHLKELGVTHVHLLPSFDFASIDEARLEEERYNWGYDPKNYNVPEGSYATDPFDPVIRIREFKEMVMCLHRHHIRVVMDVVYNHTYISDISNFDLTVPEYFYRCHADGSYSNASGCGNETASERTMVRRFIVESVKFWAKEYHVDGFRFDLMGLHDIETMNAVKAALEEIDPSVVVYGEGWTAGESPLPVSMRAIKENGKKLNGIAVFNDTLRDALKGPLPDARARGFVTGAGGLEESVKFGVAGAVFHPQVDYDKVLYTSGPYVNHPSQVVNYISCHDDLCLADKLKLSAFKEMNEAELLRCDKLAHTIVFTCQGIPFLYAGEEMFRTKKGIANSFNCPDSINAIDWSFKSEYKDLYTYCRRLIQLRKEHPAFRMEYAGEIQKSLRFLDTQEPNVVAYILGKYANGDRWEDILVIYNGNRSEITQEIPEKRWNVICRDAQLDLRGLIVFSSRKVRVPPSSAFIAWHSS